MTRDASRTAQRALAIAVGAAPFAFALIRAVQTGSDFRYFWIALASLLGAVVVMRLGRASRAHARSAVVLGAGAVVTGTTFAAIAALLIGTRWNAGMLIVAAAFGFCAAAGSLLYTLAR